MELFQQARNRMMKPNNEFRAVYFVIGVGLGIMAGLLCAPRPGREARHELRRGALDGLDYMTAEATKARAGAGRWLGKMKSSFFRRQDSATESEMPPLE
jgi:gas vesicle protein